MKVTGTKIPPKMQVTGDESVNALVQTEANLEYYQPLLHSERVQHAGKGWEKKTLTIQCVYSADTRITGQTHKSL